MKQDEAKQIIIATLKEKGTVTAHELNYSSKGTLPFVQIYGILSTFVKNSSVQMNESEGKKSYTLIDEEKLSYTLPIVVKTKPTKVKIEKERDEVEEPKEKTKKKIGRDLTTYKFNGIEYNKGRLAHAIVSQASTDKCFGLKEALELFPDEIIKPYGMIKSIKEAKLMSKERPRFFIKPEEEIKLKDCTIAVSNQWTSERIERLIAISKKQLGYKIK